MLLVTSELMEICFCIDYLAISCSCSEIIVNKEPNSLLTSCIVFFSCLPTTFIYDPKENMTRLHFCNGCSFSVSQSRPRITVWIKAPGPVCFFSCVRWRGIRLSLCRLGECSEGCGGAFSHKMEDEGTKVAFIGRGMENIFSWKQRSRAERPWVSMQKWQV